MDDLTYLAAHAPAPPDWFMRNGEPTPPSHGDPDHPAKMKAHREALAEHGRSRAFEWPVAWAKGVSEILEALKAQPAARNPEPYRHTGREVTCSEEPVVPIGTPTSVLRLSTRATNVLKNASIVTVEQVAGMTRQDITKLPKCGPTSASEIFHKAKDYLENPRT